MTDGNWLLTIVAASVAVFVLLAVLFASVRRKDAARIISLQGEVDDVNQALESFRIRLAAASTRKDGAYQERNYVVGLLARVLFMQDLANGAGPDDQWRIWKGYTPEFVGWEACIYFEPPTRTGLLQMSWHFPTNQKWIIDALQLPDGPPWDQRSMEEKYENIRQVLLKG